jgi:hypothetical protein
VTVSDAGSSGSAEHLHVHQVETWLETPTPRLVVDNGLTLCDECHRAEHAEDPTGQATTAS